MICSCQVRIYLYINTGQQFPTTLPFLNSIRIMSFPKSHGPPPREPPPNWVIPPSQRHPAVLRYKDWQIQVPQTDVESVVRTIIQTDAQMQSQLMFTQFQNCLLLQQMQQIRSQQRLSIEQQTSIRGGSLTDLPDWARPDENAGTAVRRRSRSRQANAESQASQTLRQQRSLVDVDDTANRRQEVPELGLFYHKHGQSLVESNVSHDLTGFTKMSTTVGRHPFTVTVVEYGHPGATWWTLPCVAMFKCALLKNQVDWYQLYSILCTRRRSALQIDSNRIRNAFELDRIVEHSQGWAPNLRYYATTPGYVSLELSRRNSVALQEYTVQEILRTNPETFHQHETHIRGSIQKLAEMLLLRESNFDLVEVIDLFCHPQTNIPLAMVAKLQPVVFEETPSVDSVEKLIFGHNTNEWTAASCIHEGIIRPSAVDSNDSDWLPAVGFYARGIAGARITNRTLADVLIRAQKYADYSATRPICLVGITLGRQPHITIHQGGVISEHAANLYYDIVHSAKEKRWALRSHRSRLTHVAVLLPPPS